MHIPRIYFPEELSIGKKIIFNAEISRHLSLVLRVKIDDSIIIFNGFGGEFKARIFSVIKQQVIAIIEKFVDKNTESPLEIHLLQGVSRGEKMDFTIQKAVELGVTSITPMFTEYCNVKLPAERLENKLRHWRAIAIHAAEQSGRCFVPKILNPISLRSLTSISFSGLKLVLVPGAENRLSDIIEKISKITLLIGPEGGLSAIEVADILEQQFLPIKLGPRILRTETAGLVAISVLQSMWGDLS